MKRGKKLSYHYLEREREGQRWEGKKEGTEGEKGKRKQANQLSPACLGPFTENRRPRNRNAMVTPQSRIHTVSSLPAAFLSD